VKIKIKKEEREREREREETQNDNSICDLERKIFSASNIKNDGRTNVKYQTLMI